ncbi:MAG TPA: polyphosphate kinase 2 family protein [Chromatiales bacterium]|nr:polyphosphate kinase 2 family protein [Thiotrichales bacterium]HIP68624.1 polyphosphate kinase 2 family protein [Chromatiales bacterium]
MFNAKSHPYLVPFNGTFKISDFSTRPPDEKLNRKQQKKHLKKLVGKLDILQRKLYAADKHSLLLVFQAMDAAGKDSTIRAVLSGVNPAGCEVYSFKQPSAEELDHDFLWRTSKRLPQRGRIGVFNRSYYEEVLVVRVHPEYLQSQKLPQTPDLDTLWQQRFESIIEHEKHLARNGTVILKFWLNVSREEQKNRFLSRLDEPRKHWKFSSGDVRERGRWNDYMQAYEEALKETSKPWAPWYAIPADDKPFMRSAVAEIIVDALETLDLHYPKVDDNQKQSFAEMRKQLMAE